MATRKPAAKSIEIKVDKDYKPHCRQCKYIELEPRDSLGLCHRYPPVLVTLDEEDGPAPSAVLPCVDPDKDWCGEYICNGS